MANALQQSLNRETRKWLDDVIVLIRLFFQRLRNQLESSFNEDKMDGTLRNEVCPKFAAAADLAFETINGQVAAWTEECEAWGQPECAET